jgi:hypothetical protein
MAGGTGSECPALVFPGVLTAGTFYQDGKRVFWDVHNPENTVMIELKDERYNEVIVEVRTCNLRWNWSQHCHAKDW